MVVYIEISNSLPLPSGFGCGYVPLATLASPAGRAQGMPLWPPGRSSGGGVAVVGAVCRHSSLVGVY